mmetsp:Transcript_22950/g.45181  ORF Transcript_22950/g.45181 Transcript_22950/m.45181 type:complete len:210 (-) Transcript_22950:340-969(-)
MHTRLRPSRRSVRQHKSKGEFGHRLRFLHLPAEVGVCAPFPAQEGSELFVPRETGTQKRGHLTQGNGNGTWGHWRHFLCRGRGETAASTAVNQYLCDFGARCKISPHCFLNWQCSHVNNSAVRPFSLHNPCRVWVCTSLKQKRGEGHRASVYGLNQGKPLSPPFDCHAVRCSTSLQQKLGCLLLFLLASKGEGGVAVRSCYLQVCPPLN